MDSDTPIRFAQVTDRLYRGGQPEEHHMSGLSALGVRTIVNLRREASAVARREIEQADQLGMRVVRLPFYGIFGAKPALIASILAELRRPENGIVYVHCRGGRDRTSLAVALYRVVAEGMAAEDAWQQEAVAFGHRSSFPYGGIRAVFDRAVAAHRADENKEDA